MKRILALAMCLALMLTSVVIVSADADATLTVDIIEGPISAGEDVEVCISITDWANAYAVIELVLEYDETLLELDIIEQSEFSGAMGASNGNKFSLVCNPSSDRQANKLLGGEICVAYFIAAKDITKSIPVNVTANVKGYAQGKADGWVATQELNVEIENGGIMVDDVWPPVEDDLHECTPVGEIKYDETNHWYECAVGCGNLVNVAPHEGGEATCSAKAQCTVCGVEYGDINANNHKNTVAQGGSDATCGANGKEADTFCNDCQKVIKEGAVIPATGAHTGGEASCSAKAVCSVCGTEYGALATNVHKNTKTVGAKVADCGNNGYTGDTVCNDCGKTIAYGQVIPSTGEHAGGEATCTQKAICTGCGKEYGSVNSNNHKNTVTQGGYDATCGEDGKGANTYCNDCKKVVSYGETIPATGAHTGGTATCVSKAVCTVCSQAYGEFNAENHVGGTKVVNKTATYSGDKQCNSCGVIIEYGKDIIPEGENPGFAIVSDVNGKQGDEVTVTVSLGENTALGAYTAILEFDETALQLVKMTKGDFCSAVNAETGKAAGFNFDDVTEGTLFTATFKILATTGNYEVGVNFTKSVKADLTVVTMNVTKGIVTIECSHIEGNTEVRDAVEGNCGNDGYTGDTYCKDCGVMIEKGQVIPATGAHTGGEATCCAKAVCDVCGQSYGDFNANNHKNTEVRDADAGNCGVAGYTGDTYCLDCGVMIQKGEVIPADENHIGGTATCKDKAVCDVCGKEYGELDANNHVGETEIRDAVEGNCGNDGYTGDTYCKDCGVMVEEGQVIPATGAHVGGTATCCAKAVCDVCGQEYGEFDANNHVGETEIRDAVEGNCGNDGYTGDTYCKDCGVMIEEGQVIPATGAHVGGTATCCAKAVCDVCGQEYGEFDANNHVGETEIRDAVEGNCGNDGYTGDTYCKDCGVMIQEGSVIPATGAHTGGEATCCAKAVCDVCDKEYGEFDANNHVGGTEIRDASATYTGDTYCLGCGEMIAEGEEINPTGLLGDANSDGFVNAMDAMIISQYYVGYDVAIDLSVSDVNGDGFVNSMDAMLISQFYVGLIEKFPVEQ